MPFNRASQSQAEVERAEERLVQVRVVELERLLLRSAFHTVALLVLPGRRVGGGVRAQALGLADARGDPRVDDVR